MTTRPRGHPGFDALVDCVVRELEGHGITLTPTLVHDELRLMLRRPESAGGLPEHERLDLLGPLACRRLADRLRAQLRLPDLTRRRTAHADAHPDAHPDTDAQPSGHEQAVDDVPSEPVEDREPCRVVDLDERRRRRR